MSTTDLQLQDLPKLRIPATTNIVNVPGSCNSRDFTDNQDDVVTPKSEEHQIPAVQSCPPVPRKPRKKVIACKRKLLELEFFDVVNREEVNSFFRSSFEAILNKRRCPCK